MSGRYSYFFTRRQLSVFAALLAAVMLSHLLAPAVAATTVKRHGYTSLFNVICTSAGLKVLDADTGTLGSHSQKSSSHCPQCVLGGAAPLPSSFKTWLNLIVLESEVAPRARDIHYKVNDWLSASPRGPPTVV